MHQTQQISARDVRKQIGAQIKYVLCNATNCIEYLSFAGCIFFLAVCTVCFSQLSICRSLCYYFFAHFIFYVLYSKQKNKIRTE